MKHEDSFAHRTLSLPTSSRAVDVEVGSGAEQATEWRRVA
jgi:hypothetical protein